MIIDVKVPQLSESVAEATLVSWHKQVGEALAHALDRPGTGPSVTSVRSNPWFAESGVGAA